MKNREKCRLVQEVADSLAQARNAVSPVSESLKLLLGVSGGRDSIVLLDVLNGLSEKQNISIFVAHLNHGLRECSDIDQELVSSACLAYGVSFFSKRVLPPEPQTSVEAWGREQRYTFFEHLRVKHGMDLVLTAHHQQDQAETVLFRLASGRLLSEKGAIAKLDINRHLLRPMLHASASEIEAYAKEKDLSFRQDPSNEDLRFARNRIRKNILPEFVSGINPKSVDHIVEFQKQLVADEEYLEQEARKAFCEMADGLQLEPLQAYSKPLRWRILRRYALSRIGDIAWQLGFSSYQRALSFFEEGSSVERSLDLGLGVSCFSGRLKRLDFKINGLVTAEALERIPVEELSIPGKLVRSFSDGRLSIVAECLELGEVEREKIISRVKRNVPNGLSGAEAYFDLRVLSSKKLTVRGKQDGDSLRVWSRGERKLKKVFQEQGLEPALRKSLPVLEADGEIIWVPGVVRSELAPITSDSKTVLCLRCNLLSE